MKPIQESHLYQEIHQQSAVIDRLVSEPQANIQSLAAEITARKIHHIFIAARGTSDNAGRYAKYILGAFNRMDVSLATPSLFTVYNQPPNLSDSLVLGISQSGKSPDIVSVLREGHRQGALTAAITNTPDSDLGNAAQIILDLQAGEEISLAATKTYTTQLTTLALLSAALSGSDASQQELKALPGKLGTLFNSEEATRALAERYRYMDHCVVIGRGFNYASAFEFSLKVKELTYSIAEPYSSADFLHGPVALVDRGFPVFVIAPSGKMGPQMMDLVQEVQKRQAEVVIISDHPTILGMANHKLVLPTGIPEWLSPIAAIIPGQMFAMYLAHTRGFDVDQPRGLNKVTETW